MFRSLKREASRSGHWVVVGLATLPIIFILIYIQSYRLIVPFGDEWDLDGYIVIRASDHSLRVADLFVVHDGHRSVVSNLVTALSVIINRWELRTQSFVSPVLAVLTFGILVAMFRRSRPGAAVYVLLPFSLLLFAVYREHNWWSVHHSHWYFGILFSLGAIWLAARRKVSRWSLSTVALLAVLATFSTAVGMMIWPATVLVLWLSGNRRWLAYTFLVATGLVTVALYLAGSGILGGPSAGNVIQQGEVLRLSPSAIATFVLRVIGAGLLQDRDWLTLTTLVGLIGLILFPLHIAALWRRDRALQALAPWIGIGAFALGAALLVALGRAEGSESRPFTVQYISFSALFWISFVALIAMILIETGGQLIRGQTRRLWAAEAGLLAAIFILYAYSSVVSLQAQAAYWQRGITLETTAERRPDEQCVLDYPLSREGNCLSRVLLRPGDWEMIDEVATRRLSAFALVEPISILVPPGSPESRAIISTSNPWLNIHVRDYLLSGLVERQLFHVVDRGRRSRFKTLPNPLAAVAEGDTAHDLQAFQSWLADAPDLWVVRTADAPPFLAPFLAAVERAGLNAAFHETVHDPIPLAITRYQRGPLSTETLAHFEESIRLLDWTLNGPVRTRPCQTMPLETLWTADSRLAFDVSLTAVIAGANGVGVARSEGAPAGQSADSWEAGQRYRDRRSIEIPCDLAPGDYPLLVGLYHYSDGKGIPTVNADGSAGNNLLYLTTVTVE